MKKTEKRKVYLFIVEGISDNNALSNSIQELYDQIDDTSTVYFCSMKGNEEDDNGGDITSAGFVDNGSMNWVRANNIEYNIYFYILADFFDTEKILPEDITKIIHIVDTDGAYIPDTKVICNPGLPLDQKKKYYDDRIECLNIDSIKARNRQKRENLTYLSRCTTISICNTDIPYSVYFFSCNLDHFLHNDANLQKNQKTKLANVFSDKYLDDLDGFVDFFMNDTDSLHNMSYRETWDYIKKEDNSLRRHTNINILLQELKNDIERN